MLRFAGPVDSISGSTRYWRRFRRDWRLLLATEIVGHHYTFFCEDQFGEYGGHHQQQLGGLGSRKSIPVYLG